MRILRNVLLILLVCVLYEILGILVSSAWHRPVSNSTKNSFRPEECYSDQTGTERVLCIDDNMEALLWRLRVIETAEKELVLSTFEMRDDNSGKDMMSALYHAAERGVHIRIFLDGLNGKLRLSKSEHFQTLASHLNVEVKFYAPVNPLKPWNITFCMHDKYLIADSRVYILGGRNVYDYFLGNYPGRVNIDRDLLVYETDSARTDSSLIQLRGYFESIWELSCCKRVKGSGKHPYGRNQAKAVRQSETGERANAKGQPKIRESRENAERYLRKHYMELQKRYPSAFEETDYLSATVAVNKITLLSNPQKPFCREPKIWYELAQLMRCRNHVTIQTPYIICNRRMYQDLSEIAGSTGSLEIITNAVESGANPWGCTDYLNQKSNILAAGASVCEFLGAASNHIKTILIDDRLSVVGSYNLDERSTYLDTELMLAVDSEELCEQLRRSVERDLEFCKQVFSDGTEYFGDSYVPVEMAPDKEKFYRILRTIIRPFRYLL
ncbi:MAG: phospholipase D-like domain-containing protein [Lachnospiraceae bacterium]|nr:phospholipase D-like domain-containing protein [Lachnospiraceae bacterium]